MQSHRVRLVLAEKDIGVDILSVDAESFPQDLQLANPRSSLPMLVDRDLVLYSARVIMDYLDERYPHPPFMPIEPMARARARLALYRIESELFSLLPGLDGSAASRRDASQKITQSLIDSASVFAAMPFFLSEEYSMLDAALVPLLWRLPLYGIVLPESAASVTAYAKRMFARPGFQASLTAQERDIA